MNDWTLVPCALPAMVLFKAFDLRHRLLGNRQRFARIFPSGMKRAVYVWLVVATIAFLGGPALLLASLAIGAPKLDPFGTALCVYTPIWTWVGHYVLLAQREYLRWWRLRREVKRYLSLPPDRRPFAPPTGAIVI
ncbi:MAG: hypothetical protein JWQ90_774 [Hydrocarboniphaga sp.]|uniref:hypothetical protein n=1 Tax=Hydrocarboniphaga sp. TaxID=2033016 RepID=UPI00262B4117|nr:hypothetical protein [Hydrocarboniphaga sp.]MDB5968324.1 hypothetical protein [Hydrocarboniphaga sp.]